MVSPMSKERETTPAEHRRNHLLTGYRAAIVLPISDVQKQQYHAKLTISQIWLHNDNLIVSQIGAGTALPGLVASLCGAHVTLTDKEEYPECLENCRQSCHANGHDFVKVVGITWGQFTPNLFKLVKADVILGSDCFYDTKGNFKTS